jgi:hypothetical protein
MTWQRSLKREPGPQPLLHALVGAMTACHHRERLLRDNQFRAVDVALPFCYSIDFSITGARIPMAIRFQALI